jgi:4-azaleucine resistance transporter AzlC
VAAVPLAVAVAGFGVAFGVLAREAGFSPAAAVAMSLSTFAGGAQFAAASVLSAGGTVTAAVAAAVMLNARYVPIGVSVSSALTGPWWVRLAAAQLVVDESWAVGHVGAGRYDRARLLSAGLVVLAAWTAGTALGALGGDALGDPAALGLDAMAPALFLALLMSQVKGRRAAAVAGAAALLAAVLVPVAPPGLPIVAASAVAIIAVVAARGRR